MLSYCLKCGNNTENKNPTVVKTKNGRIMLLYNCAVCGSKKQRFIKEQEASGSLCSLAKSLSRIPLVGFVLFYKYKTNEIINKLLSVRDKFLPEMHLRQYGFT